MSKKKKKKKNGGSDDEGQDANGGTDASDSATGHGTKGLTHSQLKKVLKHSHTKDPKTIATWSCKYLEGMITVEHRYICRKLV